jgi:hypothetical protein
VSTEVVTSDEEFQSPDGLEKPSDPKAEKRKAPATAAPAPPRLSNTMRAIEAEEERSLKEWLDSIGALGAFRVQVAREKPTHIVRNGKNVETKGFLETYDHSLTEEDLQREHGGGTYHLKITKRNASGAYVYEKGCHRTIVIAGDPKTERLPGDVVAAPAAVAAGAAEGPGIVRMAFDTMQRQIDRAESATAPRGIDPAMQMVLDEMRRQTARADAEMAELKRELASQRNQKPEVDPIKDKLLGTLLDGQSGHVAALQLRQEAELRQVKESALQDLKRVEDRNDRAMSELRISHEHAMASIRSGYEREIVAVRSSHEVSLASTKAANDIQVQILGATINRLERESNKLETEVIALREKKDKSVMDQIKDMKVLKEAFGDDDKEEAGGWSKFAEIATNPEALGALVGLVRGNKPAEAPAQVAAQPQRPQIVRDPATGAIFRQKADGGLVPLKKKPKIVTQEDGSQLELPEVDPGQVALVISFMERAFSANTDPIIMAQSSRSQVPPEILAWIQAHDTDQTSGVDLFLSKVAKLPGTSPLATQSGRNWVRKVGKALIS